MSAHYEKKPFCLSCMKQITKEEIAPHKHMSHRVSLDYTFGGYSKPKDPIVEIKIQKELPIPEKHQEPEDLFE